MNRISTMCVKMASLLEVHKEDESTVSCYLEGLGFEASCCKPQLKDGGGELLAL